MGQILAAGEGQNPARQAAVGAGIPFEATAYGVNQLCGSGLRTVALGYQAIRTGDSDIVVAGGQESMSQAPHCMHLRNGVKMGDAADGRHDDQATGCGMPSTAITWATRRRTSRSAGRSPASSRTSSPRALAAEGRGGAEGRPLQGRDRAGRRSRRGAAIRSSIPTSIRSTAPRSRCWRRLRPAFDKNGTVTAGNASGINDGAAAVVLMTRRDGVEARPEAAGAHRVVGDGRGRSGDHGHRADPGEPHGAEEGRLVGRRSRPDRGQRGLRRAGLRGRQGPRL